jgi:hypothetical protein
VRLGFRSSAGPFRCFARIGVEPRPYQVVPLLMALKLDPVRLLVADDVGIGKTIEACLIARELIDRGEVRRMVVLCPPQLAEQWQGELSRKFHIDAELVLPSTGTKLDRHCRVGQSMWIGRTSCLPDWGPSVSGSNRGYGWGLSFSAFWTTINRAKKPAQGFLRNGSVVRQGRKTAK